LIKQDVVSRKHAKIQHEQNNFEKYDLQSTSGTFVNDRRIQRFVLRSGDIIALANYTMMFIDHDERLEDSSDIKTGARKLDNFPDEEKKISRRRILFIDDESSVVMDYRGNAESESDVILSKIKKEPMTHTSPVTSSHITSMVDDYSGLLDFIPDYRE